ncbi:hypothetical protein [Paraburkholderia aromaticivorans]|uniref:hypothetical protein n=1 Tax=Paraburkholderia aromaticivorans TaxID=2026199 RepID=UPI0038B75A24
MLWNSCISFGGVASFIFGALIILPILNICGNYYGGMMTVFLAVTFYLSMIVAALLVESLFQALGWVSQERHTAVVDAPITFNYTTVLNITFGAVFVVLTVVFFRTGGPEIMRMMGGGERDQGSHGHHNHNRDHAHHHHGHSE